mgnify:CR=1 FL=1
MCTLLEVAQPGYLFFFHIKKRRTFQHVSGSPYYCTLLQLILKTLSTVCEAPFDGYLVTNLPFTQ